jgi:hypothetical protein
MSSKPKSKSHEAAQKKLWKADIKALRATATKIGRDFEAEHRQRLASLNKAERLHAAEQRKYHAFLARRDKKLPASLKDIHTRISILRGRIAS